MDKLSNDGTHIFLNYKNEWTKCISRCLECGYEKESLPRSFNSRKQQCPNCRVNGRKEWEQKYRNILETEHNIELIEYGGGMYKPAKLKCKTCGYIHSVSNLADTIQHNSKCPNCSDKQPHSEEEQKLFNYIQDLGFDVYHYIDSHLHIDMYIPQLGIGFEHNGLVAHSINGPYSKEPDQHYKKKLLAYSKGIQLFYLWENWGEEFNKKFISHILLNTERPTEHDYIKGKYNADTHILESEDKLLQPYRNIVYRQGDTFGYEIANSGLIEVTKCESFTMDHTKVKAPFVRIAHKYQLGDQELTKIDIRFCQPNESKLVGAAMHSMEHKMATAALKQLGDKHIDLSPMGCRTGFYWIINTTEIEETSIPSTVKDLLEESLKIDLVGELEPTEVNCGSYKYHNEELANRYIRTFLNGEQCID